MDAGFTSGVARARRWIALSLVAALVALAGCSLTRSRSVWYPPTSDSLWAANAGGSLAAAQSSLDAGEQAEAAGDPACIDFYFASVSQSWPLHAANAATPGDPGSELYRTALRKLVSSAACFGRLSWTQGLTLGDGRQIAVRYFNFLWQPQDFHSVLPVGEYASPLLSQQFVSSGVGVEYVVLASASPQRPFIKSQQPFAATAVLKPGDGPFGANYTLDFYDPSRSVATDDGLPLARDLTAPIAYAASHEGDAWLEGFIRPRDTDAEASLYMTEPFQPGKIPVVLVHGLASSPVTWSHLENQLRVQPAIMNRYQIWVFRYDTGDPFLASAAALRRQLAALRQIYDPGRCDASLSRMVIVGHSLGGLVAKLQVTGSGDQLWRSAARVPFDTLRTDPLTRSQLANSFFFGPSPDVSRVIYIATPHRGSVYARRCVGLVGSALVVEPPDWRERHAQLVRDNPDAFYAELRRGIPTSIDLLEPSSCILQATDRLPYRYGVRLHSIIGDDRWTLSEGQSDGVVAVSSAELAGVQSQLMVDASHTEIQRRDETSNEVIRILLAHAAEGP